MNIIVVLVPSLLLVLLFLCGFGYLKYRAYGPQDIYKTLVAPYRPEERECAVVMDHSPAYVFLKNHELALERVLAKTACLHVKNKTLGMYYWPEIKLEGRRMTIILISWYGTWRRAPPTVLLSIEDNRVLQFWQDWEWWDDSVHVYRWKETETKERGQYIRNAACAMAGRPRTQ